MLAPVAGSLALFLQLVALGWSPVLAVAPPLLLFADGGQQVLDRAPVRLGIGLDKPGFVLATAGGFRVSRCERGRETGGRTVPTLRR